MLKSKKNLKNLPDTPGVYLYKNKEKKILYVGKAKNLKSRISSYFNRGITGKTLKMFKQASQIDYIKTESDFEALLLEAKLVRLYKPFYNFQLKDDKSPLYIVITAEKYPQIVTLRKTNLKTIKTKYVFGPYLSGNAAKQVLKYLRRSFPFAQHKLGKKPCLYSQINLCSPCPNFIESIVDNEQKSKLRRVYLKNISYIKRTLEGKIEFVRLSLEKQMKKASQEQNFEKAKRFRQKLEALDYITARRNLPKVYLSDPNLEEEIRDRQTSSLKAFLNKHLKVARLSRIECYDVSHLSGTNPTASMVTFVDAEADKRYYRHFKIRGQKKRSDTGSLQEVLRRRKKYFSSWGKPDLIIVDGGKAQVGAVQEVITEVPVIGIAKRLETLVFKINGEYIEDRLPEGEAKKLVQKMRDEAHRFARRYHHKLVSKAIKG